MEPADLKPNSPDDAQLDALLRANLAVPSLPDDGFSGRVLAALPPPVPATAPHFLRIWLCGIAAVLGGVIVAASFSRGNAADASAELAQLFRGLQASLAPLADGSVLLGLMVTVVSLVFVYWRQLAAKLVR